MTSKPLNIAAAQIPAPDTTPTRSRFNFPRVAEDTRYDDRDYCGRDHEREERTREREDLARERDLERADRDRERADRARARDDRRRERDYGRSSDAYRCARISAPSRHTPVLNGVDLSIAEQRFLNDRVQAMSEEILDLMAYAENTRERIAREQRLLADRLVEIKELTVLRDAGLERLSAMLTKPAPAPAPAAPLEVPTSDTP